MAVTRRALIIGTAIGVSISSARADDIMSPVAGKRVALHGYDPVGYFTDHRPVAGMLRYWYEYDDTVYLFASSEHRAAFVGDPDHYAPQYRGFCALSVSIGGSDEGLPNVWEIYQGKLLVFGRPSGVQDFATDQAGFFARGQANWTATHGQP